MSQVLYPISGKKGGDLNGDIRYVEKEGRRGKEKVEVTVRQIQIGGQWSGGNGSNKIEVRDVG